MLLELAAWSAAGLLVLLAGVLLFADGWPSPRGFLLAQRLPGPPGVFLLGNTLQFASLDPYDFLDWVMGTMANYPRLMKLWISGVPYVFLYHPEDIKILLTNTDNLTKGYEYRALVPWLRDGLLTSSGSKWQSRRKLLTSAFHFKIMEEAIVTFNKNSRRMCEKLEKYGGNPVKMEKLIHLCTLDNICEAAMGLSIKAQDDEDSLYVTSLHQVSVCTLVFMTKPWILKKYLQPFFKIVKIFKQSVSYLHSFTRKVIQDRKRTFNIEDVEKKGKKNKAFLDLLIEMQVKFPDSLTDEDIQEEVDTFMFEGHDTTSSALNFLFFNLAHHPEIQEKLYNEIVEVTGYEDRDVTIQDIQKMTYLEKVFKESFRITPPVPYVSRLLDYDLKIDGYTIPSGTNCVIMPFKIHRNEEVFPDPEIFNPERFSESENVQRNPFAYIPFSAGQRNCIGTRYATLQVKSTVVSVLKKFRIEPVSQLKDFKILSLLVLRTNKPIE